jgi:hypothetical protein
MADLRAYTQDTVLLEMQKPASVPYLEGYVPPNMGPATQAALAQAQPRESWLVLGDTGALIAVHGGTMIDLPIREQAQIDHFKKELDKGAPIVMYGIGSAQALTAVRALTTRHVLVYEPIAELAVQVVASRLTMPGVTLTCDLEEFRVMCAAHLGSGEGVTVLSNPAHTEKWPEHYAVFQDIVQRCVATEMVTQTTIKYRMKEWVEHTLTNLPNAVGSRVAMHLSDKFRELPCVVVGAGPSLSKNIKILKKYRSNVVIIGTDLAGIALDKAGIVPDFFLTVEGKNLSDKLKTISFLDRVPRLWTLACSPISFQLGSGPRLVWCDSNLTFMGLAEKLLHAEGVPLGGSCTTAAMLFAEAFGCNPLIMIGNDLVNAQRDGTNYADGIPDDGLAHRHDEHGEIGAWGEPKRRLKDSPVWCHARTWFELRARNLATHRPELILYNCTEGGSHVDGWHDVPLETVLSQLPVRPSHIMTADTRSKLAEVVKNAEHVRTAADKIGEAVTQLVPEMVQASDVAGVKRAAKLSNMAHQLVPLAIQLAAAKAQADKTASECNKLLMVTPNGVQINTCNNLNQNDLRPTTQKVAETITKLPTLKREDVAAWLQEHVDATAHAVGLANDVSRRCAVIGHALSCWWPNEEVQQLMQELAPLEESLRGAATANQLLTGYTQGIAKEYQTLHAKVMNKELTPDAAGGVFAKKADLYRSLCAEGKELHGLLTTAMGKVRADADTV